MDEQKPLSGIHVLVVEDKVPTAGGTCDWLRRMGAIVDVRASVMQAKKRLMEVPFDLAIIDYQLVGSATGTDLAIWMRDQSDLRHILRVSYSGIETQQVLAGAPDD